jgi:UDP-glucose:(heptosyl)LPS alpha-1,3-glucosyltransferase
MDIAFCYESVLPARGGCETYIAALARRLVADGHQVHLYACRWDADVLPASLHYHPIHLPPLPRFLRPWWFGAACVRHLHAARHQISIGFDKTWGQDVLYPQGGLYAASVAQNLLKYRHPLARHALQLLKVFDPTHWSYKLLERRQYLKANRPLIVAISDMVQRHFEQFCGIRREDLRVVRIAPDLTRFDERDRPRRRIEARDGWGLRLDETVALFAAMNYRLKGLEPLLHAVRLLPREVPFRLLVVGNPSSRRFTSLTRRLDIADRVCFAGYCSDMRNAYFASDFVVHPTFHDPCSHVVPEAMACGLPVITTRSNGASELMHPPREGLVLDDPHDYSRLAGCLLQMLDPARRASCAHAARRTASQWTFEHHYRQMLAIFHEAGARKKAA